jgi:hypothetical protein
MSSPSNLVGRSTSKLIRSASMIVAMDRGAATACVLAYVVLVATAFLWRHSYRTTYQFCWRRRQGVVTFYVSWGQFRLYLNRYAKPDPDLTPGFRRWTYPFAPMFSTTRAQCDTIHIAAAGFTYASGRNPDTGTRYLVASVPIWLPTVVALVVAGVLSTRSAEHARGLIANGGRVTGSPELHGSTADNQDRGMPRRLALHPAGDGCVLLLPAGDRHWLEEPLTPTLSPEYRGEGEEGSPHCGV